MTPIDTKEYWINKFCNQIKEHLAKHFDKGKGIVVTETFSHHVLNGHVTSMEEYIRAVLETGCVLEVNIMPMDEYVRKHNEGRNFKHVQDGKFYKGSDGVVYGEMKMVNIFQGIYRCERTLAEFKANGNNRHMDISPKAVRLIEEVQP